MKRMHMHVAVDNIPQSVRFYSALFGVPPIVEKLDYAKWMLESPHVNFAISSRGAKAGLDHIGIQVETEEELEEIRTRLEQAEMSLLTQESTTCCYARSDKHWVQDPSGIAWESYRTLESAPTFNNAETESACCTPVTQAIQITPRKSKEHHGCC
ncbi:ArsI/CadI family heavy metal resistance metalloenzyme [Methylophilus sp. Leaf414]|uniref:ArsI/CadI family heavy metal resistance metalloenzyme n=1 Tax=Methylophilus sp. Leaf414 TaxID=1736371 RepID=UPI000700F2C5|nr:ArsI/CadI family heavy metal resistance metalloenzyme [Methylophilus sp. Leaf414]KQT38084.1 glyoxalase [Methylophilus sp. Leaf414]